MVLRCAKNLGGTIILEGARPDQVNEYVKNICEEYYEIPTDVVIFRDTRIELEAPMLVGFRIKDRKLLLPFTKRCTGSVLIEIDATKKEFAFFRTCSSESVKISAQPDR
jgi:hypothetical protein